MKMRTASLVLLLAVLVAGSAWAQPPVGAAAPTPLNSQNHYKCYDIVSHDPFPGLRVPLKDQFGSTHGTVTKPLFHCNPVDKRGEGIPYPDIHMICYEVFDQPELGTWSLRDYNQFGWLGLKTEKARLLCVPSYKYHVDGSDGSDTP